MSENIAIIILAAGKGTRMKSEKAKVLHEVLGKPMIKHIVEASEKVVGDNIIAVVGHQSESVKGALSADHNIKFAYQNEQLGTGHAAKCALGCLEECIEDVVILCGDTPLITDRTIKALVEKQKTDNSDVTVLGVRVDSPYGYGRIVLSENGQVLEIVEESDADECQKKIDIVNSGIYCVKKQFLEQSLSSLESDNAQGEYYLTDIIKIGRSDGRNVNMYIGPDSDEVIGVNDVNNLRVAEKLMAKRLGEKS